ncbi:hypothetical protein [Amorphus orientalis]|nr:hypothetical protein [Amorphus orientalis]
MGRQASHVSDGSFMDRRPERLVIEGYRNWMAGYQTGSIEPWEHTWSFYTSELGMVDGRRAVADLSAFVRTLRGCADCPLRIFPTGADRLCREECLAVGLIAAAQHGDVDLCGCCIEALSGCARRVEIGAAADRYADTLMELGQALHPVAPGAIQEILARGDIPRIH